MVPLKRVDLAEGDLHNHQLIKERPRTDQVDRTWSFLCSNLISKWHQCFFLYLQLFTTLSVKC